MDPELLRVEEVARLLSVGRTTVYGLIARGELPVVRIGRATRVRRQAVLDFVRGRESSGDLGGQEGWR